MHAPTHLTDYGWSDRVAALMAEAQPAEPGRVVRVDADTNVVATASGLNNLPALSGLPELTTGDWVAVAGGRVTSVVPRWSALVRRGADDRPQVLAANVDVVFVAAPLDRPLNINRIERELVVAWDGGAVPVVVLTKADIAPAPTVDEVRLVGVDVIVTSSVTGGGVDDVRARLRPDRTAALIGPSGAGKSALVNALLGRDEMATGAVRAGDGRGRHTTTARYLLPLPGGGVLLDTPGLRAVGLTDATDGLALAFPDVAELASGCRFRDCSHDGEPGCAVVGAVDPGRLASWLKLQREVAAEVRRTDPLARARAVQGSKATERWIRRHYRGRQGGIR